MTAIAYKDGVLAADSRITEDDYVFATAEKVRVIDTGRHGVWLIGVSGEVCNYTAMADWLEDFITQEGPAGRSEPLTEDEFVRRVAREYEVSCNGTSGGVVVVRPSGDYTLFYARSGFDGHYSGERHVSLGVVWPYLKGAMDAGASAKGAVMLACGCHGSCGPPVRTYRAGVGEVEYVILS